MGVLRRTPGARKLATRFDAAVRWRADEQLADVYRRLDELERRMAEVDHNTMWRNDEMRRVAPHVGAMEERLELLREELEPIAPVTDTTEAVAARSLIDDIRREHARARVRLTAVTQYQERLERLEEAVAKLGERS